MNTSLKSFMSISILALSLAACSSGKEETAELKGTEASKKVRAPAVFKGDAGKKEAALTDKINDNLGGSPTGRAPRTSEGSAGSAENEAKKEEDSKAKAEELKAQLEMKKAELDTAESMNRINAINERSDKAAQSNAMIQSFAMLTTLIAARQQEKMIRSLSESSKSDDGCESSAVGTAKDDFGDILESMATYGIVSKAGGI